MGCRASRHLPGRRCRGAARPVIPPPACGRGWGRVLRRDRLSPGCAAAGPHPASPASGGGGSGVSGVPSSPGEELSVRRRPHHPPSRLREGPSAWRALPGCARPPAPTRPPPQAGEEDLGCRASRHLPGRKCRDAAGPIIPPPACGRGWGRVPRRGGPCRAARLLAPPGLPRKRGRRIWGVGRPVISRGGSVGTPPAPSSPLPLAGGSLGVAGLAGLRGRRPPPGLPRKRGRGRFEALAAPSSPLLRGGSVEAPLTPPSPLPLAGGVGGGPARRQKGRRSRAAAAWVSLPSTTRPA